MNNFCFKIVYNNEKINSILPTKQNKKTEKSRKNKLWKIEKNLYWQGLTNKVYFIQHNFILKIFKIKRGIFMKAKILLCSMLILGSLSYAAEARELGIKPNLWPNAPTGCIP